MLRLYAADAIHVLHYALVFSVLLTFVIPAGEWLKYQIILICLVLLDWNDHDGQCALTALEAKLRGTWAPSVGARRDESPAFWHPMLRRLGLDVNRYQAERLNYFAFVLSLLIAFIQYCRYKKIQLAFTGRAGRAYAGAAVLLASLWFLNAFYQVASPA